MFDVIAGQDHQRALVRQAEAEQALAEPAHPVERLAIGDRAPCFAAAHAIGKEDPVGRRFGEVNQPVGQPVGVGAELARLADQDRAVRPPVHLQFRLPEANLAERRRLYGGSARCGIGHGRIVLPRMENPPTPPPIAAKSKGRRGPPAPDSS